MSQYLDKIFFPLFENFCRRNQVDGKTIEVDFCGKKLKLLVASTPKSQAKGYMGATTPPKEDEGILFVYDKEEPLQFWMKNVPFELDIIFLNSAGQYVSHKTMQSYQGEEDHDLPRYSSKKPAQFAIELAQGWCDKHLKSDSTLKF